MTPQEKKAAELAAKVNVLRNDFELYAKLNLKILDKDGRIVPLVLNDPQIYLHNLIEEQLKTTGKVRILGLKGRQQGFSTYTEARFYWKTSLNNGRSAFILTHEQAATANLFEICKRYHDNSHPGLRPHVGAANVNVMKFDLISSGYKVGTAGTKSVGRSGTHQLFHGSEVALWGENAYELFAGVLECVPDRPGTEIILESTAFGASGKFYELWCQATDPDPAKRGEYLAVFVPWFWSSEYRRDATGFVPNEDELKKMEIYGVDLEQLAWRRAKINSNGKDKTDQEYPYCWQEAFIASGHTRFEVDEMQMALKECYKPKKRLTLDGKRFIERKDGKAELSLWEEPRSGDRFCVGADVALGKAEGDYSSADVLEVRTGRQVAHWHGHIAPDLFADVLYALGKWYNNALVVCENNNYGGTTNIHLRDMNYPNIYVQHSLTDKGSDSKEMRPLGFNTNKFSKSFVIDELAARFRDPQGTGIVCKETIEECMTFIIHEDGSLGAAPKKFDDRVVSYALASYGCSQSPAYKKDRKNKR
jgi:hypothetical protein